VSRPKSKHKAEDRLLFAITYDGPFKQLQHWFWDIKNIDLESDDEGFHVGRVREKLGDWAEALDMRWSEWYLDRPHKKPNKRWKRM
jgi:hypothetical protein